MPNLRVTELTRLLHQWARPGQVMTVQSFHDDWCPCVIVPNLSLESCICNPDALVSGRTVHQNGKPRPPEGV